MRRRAPLGLRPLAPLLRHAARAHAQGDLMVREAGGATHRITLCCGRVVAARVAGRFDPLLAELRRAGLLSDEGWRCTLEALGRSERRCGQLAEEVGGVDGKLVRHALARQTERRCVEVMRRARRPGGRAWFVPRQVPPRERSASIDTFALLDDPPADAAVAPSSPREPCAPQSAHRAGPAHRDRSPPDATERRALRRLALALHPDRNLHLDPVARASLASRFALATARHHRLG